jgi:hypothetical protein
MGFQPARNFAGALVGRENRIEDVLDSSMADD